MPIKKEELQETTGPITLVGLMQDGMAYTVDEMYELLFEKSIDCFLLDDEKGGSNSNQMARILTHVSLFTLNLSNLGYKIYREYEKGTLGEGTKDDIIYYYKK